jgi:predicted nucleic acid-binding protein
VIPGRQAVVVDTNVFGAALARRRSPLVSSYAPHLTGRVLADDHQANDLWIATTAVR